MSDDRIQEELTRLGVDLRDSSTLFALLDPEQTGYVRKEDSLLIVAASSKSVVVRICPNIPLFPPLSSHRLAHTHTHILVVVPPRIPLFSTHMQSDYINMYTSFFTSRSTIY